MVKTDESWTLFLDRDGVINSRIMGGYVTRIKDFHILPGVIDAIGIFNRIFNRIIVVTNQAGVGKDLMTDEDLKMIHQFFEDRLEEAGHHIDKIYSCTDIPDQPNNCRKPHPEMAFRAQSDFSDIDFNKSMMVGDTVSDMEFGRNIGAKTILINYFSEEQRKINPKLIDYTFKSLYDFALSLNQ